MVKLVMLDRDGVINEDRSDSVKNLEEFVLLPGVLQAIARLNAQGIKVAVVTNQSAVGRGKCSAQTLQDIHDALQNMLAQVSGHIDSFFVCTNTGDTPSLRRKPAPGMLQEALEHFKIPVADSVFVGDALRDLEAATAIQCPRVLVLTGKGRRTLRQDVLDHVLPVMLHKDLASFVASLGP